MSAPFVLVVHERYCITAADGAENAVFDIVAQGRDESAQVCGGGVEYLVAQLETISDYAGHDVQPYE